MLKKLLLTSINLIIFTCTCLHAEYKVVGYYAGWSMYRFPAFYPKQIDPSLVTHINYAFAKVDTAGNIQLVDPWADIEHRSDWTQSGETWGNFKQLQELKAANPHLKTLISIGGWTLSDTFSELAAKPESRTNFARNVVKFCKKYSFDGADIDWEYPGFAEHSGRPQDKQNFTLFLAELHSALKAASPQLLLTIAAPAGPQHIANMEVDQIHQYLDWINLMTYDFSGAWGNDPTAITNHHAALFPAKQGDPAFNVISAVNAYLEKGVPAEKIIVGMPLYGRTFANATGLFSHFSGPGSSTTQEPGMRFFYDIKQNLMNTYQLHWDNEAQAPYLFNAKTKDFITFDNEDSIRLKCEYIKQMGLGGAMVWELGLDTRPEWHIMKTIQENL